MRRIGRRATISLYINFAFASIVASSEYGVPIEINLWDNGRTPLSHMVDVTNAFGLKVLAEHNFLNDNNIAFSSYGLVGILVALYEGVDGESSYQIQRGMQLPWNRNVMRIGFRDIHRTLKTYFVPEEGFLAGLALNNENVTFNDSYKKILRFYGFDLENDQIPTIPPETNNIANESIIMTPVNNTVAKVGTTPLGMDVKIAATPAPTNKSPSTKEETTTVSSADTLNNLDIRGPTPTVPESSTSDPRTESTSVMSPMSDTAQQVVTNPQDPTTETTTEKPTMPTTSTVMPVTAEITTETVVTSPRTLTSSVMSTTPSDEPTVNNEVEILTTSEMVSTTVTISTDTPNFTMSTPSDEATEGLTSTMETMTTEQMPTTLSDSTTNSVLTTISNGTSIETLTRRKKSIVDFLFTNPSFEDDYLVYRSYSPGQEPPSPNFNGHKMFLVNGSRNVQVTYMQYDTVLEHAYLPHLEASAVRLPLDSERYYLLVVLPVRGGSAELGRLLARMARESDLRDVHAALLPRRVKAVVPSFVVKGHIILTTDLQKLGIRDVFEPRQHDFAPMTAHGGVYVRSVEQAVSVAIRKYRPDDRTNRQLSNQQPVHFSATYPFLYFVMDSSIHVALMAGKMVDPLNTRIL